MFNHRRSSRLRFSVALTLVAGLLASPVAAHAQDNASSTDTPAETFQLCQSLRSLDEFMMPVMFTADDTNGQRLNSTAGLTFELHSPGESVLDVTDFVMSTDSYANDLLDDPQSPLSTRFNPRISTLTSRVPTIDSFVLLCSATLQNDDDNASWWEADPQPFPAGTTLIIRRNSFVIASASLAQKQPVRYADTDHGKLLQARFEQDKPLECTVEDNGECKTFSNIYNYIISRTGQRLHPAFAHALVAILGWQVNLAPPLMPLNSDALNSMVITPPSFYCYGFFILSLNVLEPGNLFNNSIYQMSAVGKGLAQSLSDPANTTWPEFDSCMHESADFNLDIIQSFSDYILSGLNYLHFLQTYLSDIPRGVVSESILGDISASSVHVPAVGRIPWQWSDGSVATGTVGVAYTDGVTAVGSPAPTYALTSGQLPNGLAFNTTTGAITGTATTAGTFSFSVTAVNYLGAISKDFTIVIDAPAVVAPAAPAPMKRPSLKMTRKGSTINVSGVVDTAYTGKRVTLQRLDGKKWKRVKTINVTTAKKFSTTVSVKSKSKVRYRIVAGAQISRTLNR